MRHDRDSYGGLRSSALWGKRSSSGSRSSALWGKGGRGAVALLALAVALAVPAAGIAGHDASVTAVVPDYLLKQAEANPDQLFQVIVQGTRGESSASVAENVKASSGKLKRKFLSITGVAASLSGKDLLKLARHPHVLAITPDAPLAPAELISSTTTPTSSAPTAAGASVSTSEDTSVSISLSGSSAAAGEMTFSIVTAPARGSLGAIADQPAAGTGPYSDTASVTYTPNANANGTDSFVYRVTDATGATADATVSITVAAVNDAPAAKDDVAPAPMFTGGSVTISVLGNDADVDGDPLAVKLLALPANGTVVVNADSTVTYTANIGFVGEDSFTYVASDGTLDSNVATVKVAAPARTDEDVPVPVTLRGSSATAGEMTFSIVTPPANGTLGAIADQPATGTGPYADTASLTYTPSANWSGTDSFVYRVSDAAGAAVDKAVAIVVSPVNDAPVAKDDTGAAGAKIAVLANDTDVEGDPLAVKLVGLPAYGTVVVNADSTVTYTANLGFVGEDSFTYVASDGKLDSNAATVTVTAPAQTNEDVPVSIALRGSGTFSIATAPANGTIVLNADGTATYTPKANWSGTDSFVYRVTDPAGTSVDKKVSIVVSAVNDAPVAKDDTGEAGKPIAVLANDTDVEADPLTARIVSQPLNGSAALNADGTVSYTASAGFVGEDSFTYVASDGKLDSNVATVTVTVSAQTNEDVPVSIALRGSGTFSIASAPVSGTAVLNADGTATYTPKANWSGTDSFVYRVTDAAGAAVDKKVSIVVSPVNDAPVAKDDTGVAGAKIAVLANDTDIEADPLTARIVSQPLNGVAALNADGTLTYTPKAGFVGNDSFIYVASDGKADSNVATVTVTVPAPATDEDVPLAITLTGTSAAAGEMGFAIVTPPANGTLGAIADAPATGTGPYADTASLTYTPKANWSGTDSFVYRVTNAAGASADATVSIAVSAVNDAPVAGNDSATTNAGTPVAVSVLANDTDVEADPLTVTNLTQPANGTVSLNLDKTVTYTPKAGFAGIDSFTYTANDGRLDSNVATVAVRVFGLPPANAEMWRASVHVDYLWNTIDALTGAVIGPAPQAPAIAIVDSGVDASKLADFGVRVLASVNLSSLSPGAAGDDQGHGTMVAGVATGASAVYPGVSQNAPIVSIRTADANGQSITSDVIAAADWILANKNTYGIRVANFSMAGAVQTSFRFDPLDKAVERLWFAGIVVVSVAGNHGSATGPVTMAYAPGNDPFIISVGALDQAQTADPLDDQVPWWSAYGYTMDGFSKPDMAAPGRYMIMPVPMGGTIPNTAPARVVAPGYMWMSGTSFAAPVVAGAAAQILARHPDWDPDEVKGALMLTSAYLGFVNWQAAGVGEIDAATAASLDFRPPNPNEHLYAFVETDPVTGARSFNEASWASHVSTNASWSQASWASASWASASWASASWASASWSAASWSSDVSSAMQPTASWAHATWNASTFVE